MAAACAIAPTRTHETRSNLSLHLRYVGFETSVSDVRADVVNCGSDAIRFTLPGTAGTKSFFWIDTDGVDREFGSCSGTVSPNPEAVVLQPGESWRVPCERIGLPPDATPAWGFRFEVDVAMDQGPTRLVTTVPPNRSEAGGCPQ